MLESQKTVEIQKNETQTIVCEVESEDDQSVTYSWSKNGIAISTSNNIQVLKKL